MKILGRLALALLGATTLPALAANAAPTRGSCNGGRAEVFVPAGRYAPFFKRARAREPVPVEPMCLGAAPVTNAEYLDFVRAHPEWRRSRVAKLFAEDSYLADWRDDLTPPAETLTRPVTYVSWFAAGAFCEAQGARLPNVAEWERFAGAAPPAPGRPDAPGATRAAPPFAFAMGYLPADLATSRIELAGIWEWTGDFNSSVVSGRIGNAQDTDGSLFCGDGFRAVDPSNYAAFLRYSFRSSLRGDFALRNLGFRCTREAL